MTILGSAAVGVAAIAVTGGIVYSSSGILAGVGVGLKVGLLLEAGAGLISYSSGTLKDFVHISSPVTTLVLSSICAIVAGVNAGGLSGIAGGAIAGLAIGGIHAGIGLVSMAKETLDVLARVFPPPPQ